MANGHMGKRYSVRVRHREQHEHIAWRGENKHRRRVARWGTWKTWRVSDNACTAISQHDDMRNLHRLSDVAVFFDGKRLTNEQLARRAAEGK